MPGAIDNAFVHELRQRGALGGRDLYCRAAETIVSSMDDDRGHHNRRPLRQLLLDVEEPRLAGRVEIAVPVRMNHAVDEIGVVEGPRREVEHLVAEAPGRRPLPPHQLAEPAPVLFEARATGVGVEVPLIPEPADGLGRCGARRRHGVLNRIAADEDRRTHAVGMQRRRHAGRPAAPIVAFGHRKSAAARARPRSRSHPVRSPPVPRCGPRRDPGIASGRNRAGRRRARGTRPWRAPVPPHRRHAHRRENRGAG